MFGFYHNIRFYPFKSVNTCYIFRTAHNSSKYSSFILDLSQLVTILTSRSRILFLKIQPGWIRALLANFLPSNWSDSDQEKNITLIRSEHSTYTAPQFGQLDDTWRLLLAVLGTSRLVDYGLTAESELIISSLYTNEQIHYIRPPCQPVPSKPSLE